MWESPISKVPIKGGKLHLPPPKQKIEARQNQHPPKCIKVCVKARLILHYRQLRDLALSEHEG